MVPGKVIKAIKVGCLLMLIFALPSRAQMKWPKSQLLPSFNAPANVQDLITLRSNSAYTSA